METTTELKTPAITARGTVLAFINAINDRDFEAARYYLHDDMVFDGVLGHRNGAEDYLNGMKELKFRFNVKKAFEDGNDVCLLYDVDMRGKTVFTCGWYQLRDNKIKSLKVVFDPRPVL